MAQLKISIKMAAAATISSTNWKIFTLNFCCKVCVASEMTDSVVEAVELALSAAFWAAALASHSASRSAAPCRAGAYSLFTVQPLVVHMPFMYKSSCMPESSSMVS